MPNPYAWDCFSDLLKLLQKIQHPTCSRNIATLATPSFVDNGDPFRSATSSSISADGDGSELANNGIAAAAACLECKSCKHTIRLDKLKRHISYIRSSLEKQSRFEEHLRKHMEKLKALVQEGSELPESELRELTAAVMQLKFQLPSTSFFQETDEIESPMSMISHQDGASAPSSELVQVYDNLSSEKQKCLWCFSSFDGEVKRRVLINWWIGQGLLEVCSTTKTSEQAGEEMLEALASSGFIKRIRKNDRVVDIWEMEDPSVRSFLRSKALDANFFDLVWLLKSYNGVHNLNHNVKTVFNIHKSSITDSEAETFASMKSLIVLHLGRSQITQPKRTIQMKNVNLMLKRVRKMKNLRLLSLQGILTVRFLPNSVCGLTNMTVLDLSECQALESLPSNIGDLRGLTHLDVSACPLLLDMPKGISSLFNLEVLKGFAIGTRSCTNCCSLHDLWRLTKLHKLSLLVRKEIFPQSQDLKDLQSLEQLVKLKIIWRPTSSRRHQGQENSDVVDQGSPESPMVREKCGCFGNQKNGRKVAPNEFLRLEKLDLWCAPDNKFLHAPSKYPKLKKFYIRGADKFDPLQEQSPYIPGIWKNVETLRLLYLPDSEIEKREDELPPPLFPNLTYLQHRKPHPPGGEYVWVKSNQE